MKIPYVILKIKTFLSQIVCPCCHSKDCYRHGSYNRKWFYSLIPGEKIIAQVQRYRCRNAECPRSTFSVLPLMVMPYSHFLYPDLLSIQRALTQGIAVNELATRVWHISWSVMKRSSKQIEQMQGWIRQQYQEVTNGQTATSIVEVIKTVVKKIGAVALKNRWYRHRYPLRFSVP